MSDETKEKGLFDGLTILKSKLIIRDKVSKEMVEFIPKDEALARVREVREDIISIAGTFMSNDDLKLFIEDIDNDVFGVSEKEQEEEAKR